MTKKQKIAAAGMSLIEVLLSVGIGAIVILGATQIAQDWAERSRNREEASYLITVSKAAKSYVEANFGNIMIQGFGESMDVTDNAGMVALNRTLQIPVEREAGNSFYLKDGSVPLSGSFPDTTPSGKQVRVYVRNLGFIGDQRTVEIITATYVDNLRGVKPQSDFSVQDIAQAIGPEAGIFKTDGTCSDGSFEGLFGNWSLSNNTLNNSIIGAEYCPVIDREFGLASYVAIQGRATYKSAVTEDYLYRQEIPGAPDANRMQTNLDMNGNAVTNVANMSVDNLQVIGNVNIQGATGSTSLFVDQGLRVLGDGSTVAGSMQITDTPSPGSDPSVVVSTLQTGDPDASDLAVSARHIDVDDALTVGGSMGSNSMTSSGEMSASQIAAVRTIVDGRIDTTNLQVGSNAVIGDLSTGYMTAVTLDAGNRVTTNTLDVMNDVQIGGQAVFNGGLTSRGILQANGSLSHCRTRLVHKYPWGPGDFQMMSDPYDCVAGPN